MARRGSCPPGVICFSEGFGTIVLILCGVAIMFVLFGVFMKSPTIIIPQQAPTIAVKSPSLIASQEPRLQRAPQPLRDWMGPPEFPPRGGLTSLPINIPTQGLPESFQSIGIIKVGGDQVLPLYGRRTTGSSDRWNYYTRTDSFNPVPVPIQYQRRDCMDDVGCQEIFSGETLRVDALNKEGAAQVYRFDGPKYIPGIL